MTRKVLPLGAVMMCLAGVPSISAPVPKEGTAFGVDIGATAAGAFVHAVAATFALELPLSGGWAVSLEPSFYTATGTDAWILQINAAALARWYPFSGPAHWGPVLAAGAVAAMETFHDDPVGSQSHLVELASSQKRALRVRGDPNAKRRPRP